MKIVERVVERRIRKLANIDSMQFGFMPGRERQTHCLWCEECKRIGNIGIRRKNCTGVL